MIGANDQTPLRIVAYKSGQNRFQDRVACLKDQAGSHLRFLSDFCWLTAYALIAENVPYVSQGKTA